MKKPFDWGLPSEKKIELQELIGDKIIGLIKTSFETYQEHLEYTQEVKLEGYADKKSFFKYSFGCILIQFESGKEYLFGSAEDLNSVMFWCEKKVNGELNPEYVLLDKDILETTNVLRIENNKEYLELLKQKIRTISILERTDLNAIKQGLPSEVGVSFVFQNNKNLILSHNLTDNNFVFSVLTDIDRITTNIKEKFVFK